MLQQMQRLMQKVQHLTEKELELIQYFYYHKKGHVRKIKRAVDMSEHTLLKYLDRLEKRGLIGVRLEGNLKIYESIDESVELSLLYSYIDLQRLRKLEHKRFKALWKLITELKTKDMPYFILLFGSTAKGNYTRKSDIDVISVHNNVKSITHKEFQKGVKSAKQTIKAETGIEINLIPMSLDEFRKEMKNKENHALQDALNTGYPIFGNQLYYGERSR
jgi:predicted nucleotidyltransferase/DNA-binding HxlR family transcriptional regulator